MRQLFKQHGGMLLLGASILFVILIIAGCTTTKQETTTRVEYWDNLAKGAKHVGSQGK